MCSVWRNHEVKKRTARREPPGHQPTQAAGAAVKAVTVGHLRARGEPEDSLKWYRIIEVGSGFSSSVILDTIFRFFPNPPEITFIDPHIPTILLQLSL